MTLSCLAVDLVCHISELSRSVATATSSNALFRGLDACSYQPSITYDLPSALISPTAVPLDYIQPRTMSQNTAGCDT